MNYSQHELPSNGLPEMPIVGIHHKADKSGQTTHIGSFDRQGYGSARNLAFRPPGKDLECSFTDAVLLSWITETSPNAVSARHGLAEGLASPPYAPNRRWVRAMDDGTAIWSKAFLQRRGRRSFSPITLRQRLQVRTLWRSRPYPKVQPDCELSL